MISRMVKLFVHILMLQLFSVQIFAQSKDKKAEQQSLELPIVVVQGQDKFDVPAVIKKTPGKTPAVNRERLDSLNTLDKQRPALVPASGLPEPERTPKFADGFIEGQFGQFITPEVMGGIGFTAGNYRLYADGNISGSGGHIDNASYLTYGAGLSAVYVAPEKFIFFGGSRTESAIHFGQKHYKLYANQEPPERTTTDFSIGADISGLYDGYNYTAAGAWSRNGIAQTGNDVADNALTGNIHIGKDFGGYNLGAQLLLDFHTLRGTGYNLIEVTGQYQGSIAGAAVEAEAGFQTANNSNETSTGAFKAAGKMRLPLSQNFSLGASITTGLERTVFGEFLEQNPYLSSRTQIKYAQTSINVGGMMYYHPVPTFSAGVGAKFILRGNAPFFQGDTLRMFAVTYADMTQTEAIAELTWKMSGSDIMTANVTAVSAKFRDTSGTVPYLPALRAAAAWSRNWSERLGTQITAVWSGEQYVHQDNKRTLDGFFTLGFRADYTFRPDISFFARLTNITNSTIQVWDGYRERGIYAAAGVLWKF